jgi:hypothetical protein
MEALFVDQENSYLRIAVLLRIVERPHFKTDDGRVRSTSEDVGATIRAELASRWPFQVAPRELFGVPLVYLKPATGIAMITLGAPPLMYWHSRQ